MNHDINKLYKSPLRIHFTRYFTSFNGRMNECRVMQKSVKSTKVFSSVVCSGWIKKWSFVHVQFGMFTEIRLALNLLVKKLACYKILDTKNSHDFLLQKNFLGPLRIIKCFRFKLLWSKYADGQVCLSIYWPWLFWGNFLFPWTYLKLFWQWCPNFVQKFFSLYPYWPDGSHHYLIT